jgi:hypothetical protein
MMLLNGNENAGRVEARGAAGARERRGSARETFAGPRRRVPLILGRTSSTNRILAEAYSTPTTNPRMRITRDIPRHHIAVDTERCSVVVRARTGAAAASRDTGPAPDRRCGSRDAIAEHSAHRERLSRVSPREKPRLGKSTRNRDDPPVRQITEREDVSGAGTPSRRRASTLARSPARWKKPHKVPPELARAFKETRLSHGLARRSID